MANQKTATPLGAAGDIELLVDDALNHAWIHQLPFPAWSTPERLTIFARGEGSKLYDVQGREYIDGMSGAWVANVGHGRTEIAQAMAEQAASLAYASSFNFLSPPAVKLAAKLAEPAPEPLTRCFIGSGGAEAVEAALGMVRQYHYNRGDHGRYKIITRRGSYHGSTFGGKSLSGLRHGALDARFGPLLPGVVQVTPPGAYRSPYGFDHPEADLLAAREVERALEHEGPETVAAVFGETISVAGELYVPSPEYWQIIRAACDRHGVLLVLDEVLVGMGRTGRWFAAEHFGVAPDIMTASKGIASGYAPISAAMASAAVADPFMADAGAVFAHGYTYGNHPVACAAALKNIEILERENLVARAAQMGLRLLDGLSQLKDRHPAIGDVRGLGLLCAVDMVADRKTRAHFPPSAQMQTRVNQYLMDEGVFVRVWDVIHVAPPFVVTEAEIDRIVAALDVAIGKFEAEIGLA
jgi:adenosylmethionine-8-amino-7-oxononanoate aminotransferase